MSWLSSDPLLEIVASVGLLRVTVKTQGFLPPGTEVIEINAQVLRVQKSRQGHETREEYGVGDCRELQWSKSSGSGFGRGSHPRGLICKVGWKRIRFGHYLSEDQAIKVLVALQQALPEVAQILCSYPGGKKHFTTLDLS